MLRLPDLPGGTWKAIWSRTLSLTLTVASISVLASHALLTSFAGGLSAAGLIASAVLPIVLGGPTIFVLFCMNGTLAVANARLKLAATHDSLTNCLNHGAFVEKVTGLLDIRTGLRRGAFLVADADYFKSINDRFGHAYGDMALKMIASAIRGAIRPEDIVGRLGGEEFGIFMPDVGLDTAAAIAESIREAVEVMALEIERRDCSLSLSIGGAAFLGTTDFDEVFGAADTQLYLAKDTGRNTVKMTMIAAPAKLRLAHAG